MSRLEAIGARIAEDRSTLAALRARDPKTKIGEITLGDIINGSRVPSVLGPGTSRVSATEGLFIRDLPVSQFKGLRVTELLGLLLTGDLGSARASAAELNAILTEDAGYDDEFVAPEYLEGVVEAMPDGTHPMVLMQLLLTALCPGKSEYERALDEDPADNDSHWQAAHRDQLRILRALVPITGLVFQHARSKVLEYCPPAPDYDWVTNLAWSVIRMEDGDETDDAGFPTGQFAQRLSRLSELLRLFVVLHSDHGSGNASAHAGLLVASTQASMSAALSAAAGALAGRRHGGANERCLEMLIEAHESIGGVPDREQVEQLFQELGRVPGFGHGKLKVTDPRCQALFDFGREHFGDDPVFQTALALAEFEPKAKQEKGIFPNVDLASGALLRAAGVRETQCYTALFMVARAFGITSQLVLAAGLGFGLERSGAWSPQSLLDAANRATEE